MGDISEGVGVTMSDPINGNFVMDNLDSTNDAQATEIVPCDNAKKNMRSNVFKTIALYSTFLIMGMSSPLLGATYVHLGKLYQVTAQTISIAIVISSGGYLLGAVACGILYDRIKPETLFAAFNAVGVVSSFVVGYAENFYVFIAAMVVHEIAFGFDDAAGQSYCVGLWADHKLKKPLLQGVHAVWSLGGIFGPMIIKLFLCEIDADGSRRVSRNDSNWTALEINTNENVTRVDGCSRAEERIDTTRYAFIALGVIAFVANLPFVILCVKGFVCNCKSKSYHVPAKRKIHEAETTQELVHQTSDVKNEDKVILQNDKSTSFTVIHVIFIFAFTLLNIYTELLPILFLMPFALKHLEWSVMNSSLLLSVYYGAHFSGRVIGVLSSVWISPARLLCLNLTVTITAHLLMLSVNDWPNVAWISAAIAGFGVSTTFPTNVLWISESTEVTGKMGAIMIIGMCSCTMTAPYIVASVTSAFGQMWYVYILVIAAVANVIVFLWEVCFINKHLKGGDRATFS